MSTPGPPSAPSRRRFALTAADGTSLSGVWTEAASPTDSAVVVLPGFWRRADSPRLVDLQLAFARRWHVVSLDFRGHGQSGGRFTFGSSEHLDVEALLAAAAARGIRRAALVGLSMGGSALVATLARPGAPALPLEVRGAVTMSSPGSFGAIRPRPWRGGRRNVAWEDAWRIPRVDWRFPWSEKLAPERLFARWPDVPVRLLHARHDWLVDHSLGERLHAAAPSRGELYLLDVPGALHADELLARARDVVLRLVVPFVTASLVGDAGPPADADLGREVDASPWRDDLEARVGSRERLSPDVGGVGPEGRVETARALVAGRDGVHLVFRAGGATWWARGLRDGSVHGLNLLGNALAADAPAWPARLREAVAELARGLRRLRRDDAERPQNVRVVRPRGRGGFDVE